MNRSSRTLLLAGILGVLVGVAYVRGALRALADNLSPALRRTQQASQEHAQDPTSPAATRLSRTLADQRTFDDEANRIRPDRRFGIALETLPKILEVPDVGDVVATHENGAWMWSGRTGVLGQTSDLAGFSEQLDMLRQRAQHSGARFAREALSPMGPLPLGVAAVRAAEAAGMGTDNGELSRSRLEKGAAALAVLSFQCIDATGTSDVLLGRALAALAAAEAGGASLLEEEVLMASALGYERSARDLAGGLPQGPLRAFILKDARMLEKQAESKVPWAVYLWQRHLASLPFEIQRESARRTPPDTSSRSLEQLAARLQAAQDFAERASLAKQTFVAAFHEAVNERAPEGGDEPIRPLPGGGLLPIAEQALASLKKKTGPFWDGAVARAYYRGHFFDSLYRLATLEIDTRADPTGAQEFLRELGRPTSASGQEFAHWLRLRLRVLQGNRVTRDSLEAIDQLPSFGRRMKGDLHDDVVKGAEFGDPVLIRASRKLIRQLDARPANRPMLAYAAWADDADIPRYERLTRSTLGVLDSPDARLWLALLELDPFALRGLADDAQTPTRTRFEALESLVAFGLLSPAAAAPRFQELVRSVGDQFAFAERYVAFLEKRGETHEALAFSERWLEWNLGRDDLAVARIRASQARLLAAMGRLDDAWNALEPALESYQHGVLMTAAKLLAQRGEGERAKALAAECMRRYPGSASAATLAEVLWRIDQPKEAARLLAKHDPPFRLVDWRWTFGKTFGASFQGRPPEKAVEALVALNDEHVEPRLLREFILGREDRAKQAALSFELFQRVSRDPDPALDADEQIDAFSSARAIKGRLEAEAWLSAQIPGDGRLLLAFPAYMEGEGALLWSLVPESTDESDETSERAWVLRQALALRGDEVDPAHERALAAHFARPSDNYLHQVGRYLRKLETEEGVLRLGAGRNRACSVAYYLGLRAQVERRFDDASLWYRVAVDTGAGEQPEYTLAHRQLASWQAARETFRRPKK